MHSEPRMRSWRTAWTSLREARPHPEHLQEQHLPNFGSQQHTTFEHMSPKSAPVPPGYDRAILQTVSPAAAAVALRHYVVLPRGCHLLPAGRGQNDINGYVRVYINTLPGGAAGDAAAAAAADA